MNQFKQTLVLSAVLALYAGVNVAMEQTSLVNSVSVLDLPYQSVLKNYAAHTDVPLRDWKISNDAVRAAGGWKEYLKESQAFEPSHKTEILQPKSAESAAQGAGHSAGHKQNGESKKP